MNKESNSSIYTKEWVVSFMLNICGYTEKKNLSKIKIIEPSCGDGSFVLEIVSRMLLSAQKYGFSIEDLKDNLLAFETSKSALNVAIKKIIDLLVRNNVTLETAKALASYWFKEGDFILSNESNVDFVIGNPPYIRGIEIDRKIRSTYCDVLESFTLGTDIYVGFIERGLKSLNSDGRLCFICSDRWQKNQFGLKLREYITNNNFHLTFNCKMYDVDAFESKVTAYPSIFIIEQNEGYEVNITCSSDFNSVDAKELEHDLAVNNVESKKSYSLSNISDKNLYNELPTLEQAGIIIGIGIATGKDKIYMTSESDIVETEQMIPLAYSRDIKEHRFIGNRWLISPWKDGDLVNLSEYPKLNDYFSRHKEELSARYVAKKNPNKWYSTIDKIRPGVLERKKLLIRDMSSRPEPIFDEGNLYPHHNLYFLISDEWDLEVLGGILISDVIFDMMKSQSVEMRGKVIRNQAQYLRKIKVPHYSTIPNDERQRLKVAFRNYDHSEATRICERIYEKYE